MVTQSVVMLCSLQLKLFKNPPKAQSEISAVVQHLYSEKVLKWNISMCVASCYIRALRFMAKPIVRNLMWSWCNARRDVRADVAVTEVSLFARYVPHTARKVQKTVSKFVLGSELRKAQHIFQLLLDKEVGETVMDSLCSSILLHFLLSNHLRVNHCGMVQRMKPVQAAWSVGSSLGYFQYARFNLETAIL